MIRRILEHKKDMSERLGFVHKRGMYIKMKKKQIILLSLILVIIISAGVFAFFCFNKESSFLDVSSKDITAVDLKVIGLSSSLFGGIAENQKAAVIGEIHKNEIISKTPIYGLPTCKIVLSLKDGRVVEISPETKTTVFAVITKNGFTLSEGIIATPKTASILQAFEAKAQAIYENELKEQK